MVHTQTEQEINFKSRFLPLLPSLSLSGRSPTFYPGRLQPAHSFRAIWSTFFSPRVRGLIVSPHEHARKRRRQRNPPLLSARRRRGFCPAHAAAEADTTLVNLVSSSFSWRWWPGYCTQGPEKEGCGDIRRLKPRLGTSVRVRSSILRPKEKASGNQTCPGRWRLWWMERAFFARFGTSRIQ